MYYRFSFAEGTGRHLQDVKELGQLLLGSRTLPHFYHLVIPVLAPGSQYLLRITDTNYFIPLVMDPVTLELMPDRVTRQDACSPGFPQKRSALTFPECLLPCLFGTQ